MRKSGILLPISSIPSQYGIGTFSKEAYAFIDFLSLAGQKIWQILPLGPTGYGDSPYQSFSTFAGNPYYIDLEALVKTGWLTTKECESYDFGSNLQYVDYEKIYASRFKVLRKAFERAGKKHFEQEKAYQDFVNSNAFWLDDYTLYMAIKNNFGGISWTEWDDEIKLRKQDAMEAYKLKYKEDVDFYKFLQYLFYTQWIALKSYANEKGIEIVGDIPIYVAFDSADTWANPRLFQLDDTCTPIVVAGCPPDAFTETGQLWGNPLYDWDYHKKTNFAWWMKRIAYCFQLYDVVRIDHFRGFDEYWSVPYGDPTAEKGKWCKGPGYAIFDTMKKTLGERKVIAEDLGYMTESVMELVKRTGYPGMKILQFAFDSKEESIYLPHNYTKNCVVYTGTHDNDTTLGWYTSLAKEDRKFADKYLNIRDDEEEVEWEFIRAAISSVADIAIIPMQDYLGLDETARINIPSTLGDNWKWRMKKNVCTDKLAERIKKLSKLYGRV